MGMTGDPHDLITLLRLGEDSGERAVNSGDEGSWAYICAQTGHGHPNSAPLTKELLTLPMAPLGPILSAMASSELVLPGEYCTPSPASSSPALCI